MNSLTQDYPAILLDKHEPPCLSLYQPTHRQHPENTQDPIRFRNLVKEMEESLRKKYPSRDITALLRPFEDLAEDRSFWNHTADGLAVLSAPGLFRVYRLQRPVVELSVVADSFHTKPLMRIVQSADRYQILGLSRHAFKMFEGNRDALDEIQLIESAAQVIDEQQGKDEGDREGAHRAYSSAGRPGAAARHGTDVKQDVEDRNTQLFFRAVDEVVLKHYSQPLGQRLILAALPQHHHLFRAISSNPLLMSEGINTNPEALSLDALRERAWQLVQPYYLERLAGLVESFGAAAAKGQGADDLSEIATAAIAGRIATLLIEADRLIPGYIDATSGQITTDNLSNPEIDDVLDDLGEHVLKTSGEVVIVPSERMPTQTGAAAIYRF
ncbi:conserved hypothetical protein [Nitrosococcus oceani ATCC 19707]|uniref:Uncharacterized protein n=2 Tax=Nitrosococcus oceani TaxID=1229 RepID=Q3JA89_NITOC|nr:hypothetical protein [Nitrosococcus oceani]ABA58257.1 conserved hypothetical protein [Nitrosococcus oceani ATCC 19707]EDZ67291.1 hypothetical protein NOC27_618 [Nitrosococcus oceani AFC27]KFI19295.1 hypothetical protein IB75_09495 [Nitrosococcus oceani C-27]GEM20479.1 hypothetical protein NONS58_18970 [Nitrosococcus oceani]